MTVRKVSKQKGNCVRVFCWAGSNARPRASLWLGFPPVYLVCVCLCAAAVLWFKTTLGVTSIQPDTQNMPKHIQVFMLPLWDTAEEAEQG